MENIIDFHDIYGYYHVSFWDTTWFKITMGISIMLLVAITILLIVSRKKKKSPVSPWERARQELFLLAPEKYTHKEMYKKFYFQLSYIIKKYLDERYSWNIQNKTDTELIDWLEKQQYDQEIIDSLKKIAMSSQEVKFANVEALRSQAEMDKKTIMMIIEKTIPKETI